MKRYVSAILFYLLCESLVCAEIPEGLREKIKHASEEAQNYNPNIKGMAPLMTEKGEFSTAEMKWAPRYLGTLSALMEDFTPFRIEPNEVAKGAEDVADALVRLFIKPEAINDILIFKKETFKDVPVKSLPLPLLAYTEEPVDFTRISGSGGHAAIQVDLIWRWAGFTIYNLEANPPDEALTEDTLLVILNKYFILPPEPWKARGDVAKPLIKIVRRNAGIVSAILYMKGAPWEEAAVRDIPQRPMLHPGWDPQFRLLVVSDGTFIHVGTGAWLKGGGILGGSREERANRW